MLDAGHRHSRWRFADVLKVNVTGFVIDWSAEEFRDAVYSVLNEPSLARKVGSTARKMIEDTFSIKKVNEGVLSVYKEILA